MSPSLQNRNAPSKNCTVSGCAGMMTLRSRQEAGSASHNPDGSAGATWVCDNDPTHTEVGPAGEE
jgi:hypothetical protein